MERKIGEIAKRMKNKWMKRSERGAENPGNLLMKMRFEMTSHESFMMEHDQFFHDHHQFQKSY